MASVNSETLIDHLLVFGPAYLILLVAFALAALLYQAGSAIKGESTDALIYAAVISLIIDAILNGPIRSYLESVAIVVYPIVIAGFTLFILLRKTKNHIHDFLKRRKA